MLRRMDGGAHLARRAAWSGAGLMRRALEFAGTAVAMLLLCRAQPAAGLAPFGMAFMAAALAAGWSAAALLAGGLVAAAVDGLRGIGLALPLGMAFVLGGSLAGTLLIPDLRARARRWRRTGVSGKTRRPGERPAPAGQARSPNSRLADCAALAGLGTLAPGLILAGGAPGPSLLALGAALASVAAAPFTRLALDVRPDRKHLAQDERLGLAVLAGALAAGLATLASPAALCLCGAAAMAAYPCGAAVGVGLGAALLAATGDARVLALAAVAGTSAQWGAHLPRRAREGACFGATLVAALFLRVPAGLLAGAGLAAPAVMALPGRWLRVAESWARPEPACDPARLAMRLERASARQLRAMGAAFGDLAEGYLAPDAPTDAQALILRMRERLCAGCGAYAACWSGDGNRAARWLCDLVAAAVEWSNGEGDAPLFDGEMPPEALRRCRRGRLIPERVGDLLEDFARTRRAARRRGAENRLISAQFDQARRMLDGLAARQARSLRPRMRQSARAAAVLERAGFRTAEVMALGVGGAHVAAALAAEHWTSARARAAAAALTQAFGRVYAPSGFDGREAVFLRQTRLRARCAAACVSGRAGAPSGDSHLVRALDDGRLLALVCDGMGSGADAARESAAAVRLLGRFLAAGAPAGLAIDAVNALLLNRGGDDMFCTVDLLLIDLTTGAAELVKLAASPTLLLRGGAAEWIGGGRLPLGILEEVRPAVARVKLLPGDALLMGSDGVMDAADGAALEDALRAGGDARTVARRALAAAEAACADARRDDMTALCVRIEERGR